MKKRRIVFQMRIDEELSQKMANYRKEKSVNWSALIKNFIERTLEERAK
jgi:predicted DNA-binding protein